VNFSVQHKQPDGFRVIPTDRADFRQRLSAQIASRDWWIFICASAASGRFLIDIEERYYSGSANVDFELTILPSGLLRPSVVVIVAARKHWMPAHRLIRTLARFTTPDALEAVRADIGQRDVIQLDDASPADAQALALRFLDLLEPGAAAAAAMRN